MIIMGIETSCDETAVAIIEADDNGHRCLSHALSSQTKEHSAYGGVVPEIAARAHIDKLDKLVATAVNQANIDYAQLDVIAATAGPGLIGGVIVGVMTAKALALVHDKPFIAVNHLEGHALSVRYTDPVGYPYLLLLVSGGHCQLLEVLGVGLYNCLGTTLDDAAGECFDKVAKMLGLGFPGGPALAKLACYGDAERFKMPLPLRGRPGCNFSFSGMKTAARKLITDLPVGPLKKQDKADISAVVQLGISNHIVDRCSNAFDMIAEKPSAFVAAGGVAANLFLRQRLTHLAMLKGFKFVAPSPELCTDNAIMIAWAGLERYRLGLTNEMNFKPRSRWPLESLRVKTSL